MHVLSRIINVIILAIILTYVAAMKLKCGYCTDIPESNYVTTLSTIILIQVFLFALFPNQARSFMISNKWFILVLLVINVANMLYLYRFIGKMNESHCRQCSSEWRRTFLYYYSTFVLIIYAINIVMLVLMFPFMFNSIASTKHRKN
jgi:hypothetical protein